jgi:hypothetical protein
VLRLAGVRPPLQAALRSALELLGDSAPVRRLAPGEGAGKARPYAPIAVLCRRAPDLSACLSSVSSALAARQCTTKVCHPRKASRAKEAAPSAGFQSIFVSIPQ